MTDDDDAQFRLAFQQMGDLVQGWLGFRLDRGAVVVEVYESMQ